MNTRNSRNRNPENTTHIMANKATEINRTTSMTVGNAEVKKEEMKSSPLHKFFVSALKDIYYAENAILAALVKMQDAATRT